LVVPEPLGTYLLFNSYEFIFLFLPIAIVGFFVLGALGKGQLAIPWLVAASLFYYGWWNISYVALIICSIAFNYLLGLGLTRRTTGIFPVRMALVLGIAANLGVLGYFKYANFLVDNFNSISGAGIELAPILLPIAISFFTFQQIAYLVDAYRGQAEEYGFLRYCLFVTFFPQLIAGPIVHHSEMLPQFARSGLLRLKADNLAVGATIFFFGLFKKVAIADVVGDYATPVFVAAQTDAAISFVEGWAAALSYSFQIYFDFSGYSDMAIGLALIFGIRLPINFNSPYKAASIIDFWRRWHMTLSRFLLNYLYIPLGGNRKGPAMRYCNLAATMLLGGLWHGAGWTFVAWGGLHGGYLVINHGWRSLRGQMGSKLNQPSLGWSTVSRIITFLAVLVAWVFFRADSFGAALNILEAMAGLNGVSLPENILGNLGPVGTMLMDLGIPFDPMVNFSGTREIVALTVVIIIVWSLPNIQQIMANYLPHLEGEDTIAYQASGQASGAVGTKLLWRPSIVWAGAIAFLTGVAILHLDRIDAASEFLYFQF
jgi:D-alanyl-lipoteichoic acid acyltransferase DltB (MBOAT superfamily)